MSDSQQAEQSLVAFGPASVSVEVTCDDDKWLVVRIIGPNEDRWFRLDKPVQPKELSYVIREGIRMGLDAAGSDMLRSVDLSAC